MPEIIIGRDDEDLEKFKNQGTIFLGKHIVGTGEDAHLTTPVLMDVARPHVIILTGKRGEGKSYSLGVMAEELKKLEPRLKRRLCGLIIDTQGIFWTMKTPNEEDYQLLRDWKIEPKGFDASVFVPKGQYNIFTNAGVDFDGTFSVAPSELATEDWLTTFKLDPNETKGILLQRILSKLKNYTLDDIITEIHKEQEFDKEKMALENMIKVAKTWGIFGETKMPKILEEGKLTILDVSLTPWNIRSLLVSIVMKKIFNQRTKARRQEESDEYIRKPVPFPWIFIDEAHNFVPAKGNPASLETLNKIIKEGRQPGITLVLATQRPEKLHPDALAQADLIISHRLTSKADINALRSIMQTYMHFDIEKYIHELPKWKGTAIVLDDNSERLYKIRVRPKQSWHAGASPNINKN